MSEEIKPSNGNGQVRIGVYICHCGVNIAATVNVAALRDFIAQQPHVVVARDYKFMCSDPGQDLIKQDIKNLGVNRVAVASCSPLMHELTFRLAAESGGLNRYLVQIANIREHCSWVHDDKEAATAKAMALVNAAVRRVALHQPLQITRQPLHKATLIVGAGITGIQAALEIANAGHHVYLVEREPSIGGRMGTFDKTFPHSRLRRLHPDAQDGIGRSPEGYHAPLLFRGRKRLRLHRQFHGEGEEEGPLRRYRQMHRVRPMLEQLPRDADSGRPGHLLR